MVAEGCSEAGGPLTKGRRKQAAILEAARAEFAVAGYERATIRGIARAACVDPGLVMQYFGSKENLFRRAAQFELDLSQVFAGDPETLPERLLRHFFVRWEAKAPTDPMIALLRSSLTNEQAAGLLRRILTEQTGCPLAHRIGGAHAETRAGLVGAFLLGMGMSRYLVGFPALAEADLDEVVALAAPALRQLLRPDQPAPVAFHSPGGDRPEL